MSTCGMIRNGTRRKFNRRGKQPVPKMEIEKSTANARRYAIWHYQER